MKKGDKVRMDTTNGVLSAYGKAGTVFYIGNIYGEGPEAFVELVFENGKPLKTVVRGYDIAPYSV